MIHEDCHNRKKNLSTAWVDYQKAFDSVPHDWILKCLELYKIDPKIINFLKFSMTHWETSLILNHMQGTMKSEYIRINRGIFQGDSLSPLLFCISLYTLSRLINEHKYGYECQKKVFNH